MATRAPIPAVNASDGTVRVELRGFEIDTRSITVRWIEPLVDDVPAPSLPPGISRMPGPGEAVLSPGLLAMGVTAEDLGFEPSDAGTGPGGAIGEQGLATLDEPMAWVRPVEDRTLTDRAVAVARFSTMAEAQHLRNQGLPLEDPLSPGAPLPSPSQMQLFVLLALGLPAFLLLLFSCRARSEARTRRSETLLRLGVRGSRVRQVLAIETCALALLGCLPAAALYMLAGARLNHLPFTDTVFVQGALALPGGVIATVVLGALALIAVLSVSVPLTASLRAERAEKASAWRIVPALASVVFMCGSLALRADGAVLYGAGVLLAAFGIPLAAPLLASWLSKAWRKRTPPPSVWLATARVALRPRASSATASLLSVMVLLGSVALSVGAAWAGERARSHDDSPLVVVANWVDPKPGDTQRLVRNLDEVFSGLVVLPLRQGGQYGQVAYADSCASLRPVAAQLGGDPCSPNGGLADGAAQIFDHMMLEVSLTTAPPPEVGSGDVLILTDGHAPMTAIYQAGKGLAAFNPAQVSGDLTTWNPATGWVISGGISALLILGAAVVRELIERSRNAFADRGRLARLGLLPTDALSVGRWSVLIPVLAVMPLGYLCGLAASLGGTSISLTTYVPVWISLATLGAVAVTWAAAWTGSLVAPQDNDLTGRT